MGMPYFQAKREFDVIIGVLFSESISLQCSKLTGTRMRWTCWELSENVAGSLAETLLRVLKQQFTKFCSLAEHE